MFFPCGDKFLIQVLLFRPPLTPPNLGGEIVSSPLSSCLASVLRPSEGEFFASEATRGRARGGLNKAMMELGTYHHTD